MDATILVNRTHRLPRKAIPQTLVEPEIIFDAPVGDRKRLLAVSAAKGVEALFARGKEEGIYLCGIYSREYNHFQRKIRAVIDYFFFSKSLNPGEGTKFLIIIFSRDFFYLNSVFLSNISHIS